MIVARADEGMWLLPMLQQFNEEAMRNIGCRLTAKDIYDINNASLKDAIVQFGGGCTGEVISQNGLVSTNHHCGYSSIQRLSTPEKNYLEDGFFAKSFAEEIPVPGLSVKFMKSMADVTDQLESLEGKAFKEKVAEIEKASNEANPNCQSKVMSFYNNNVWYLIVYKTYKDIRFVGAPPVSMGKFGGETDNWMWPRHTCDFSMFRVYAGSDNLPAEYSESNVPYKPARSLKIATGGVKENDFAMVMGYPGRTQRYQTAAQLNDMIETNRIRIDARTVRQDIMWEAMCADPSVQLKYADKYAGSANGWKKWQGEELAFRNLNIIGREEEKEAALKAWIDATPERKSLYGDPVADIAAYVKANEADNRATTLLTEAPLRIELLGLAAGTFRMFSNGIPEGADTTALLLQAVDVMKDQYRDYVEPLDRKEAVALLDFYRKNAREEDYLQGLGGTDFASLDIPAYVQNLFDKSVFTSYEKAKEAASKGLSAFADDPAVELYNSAVTVLMKYFQKQFFSNNAQYDTARKHFAAALMEWQKGQAMYPDANSTMRLTYGKVLPYSPKDGLKYLHFTTAKGLLEKENPEDPEFILPAGIKDLLLARDYGRWADADGTLHTCFLTNNDITGGNSGSPVLNARGDLIGLAFDGNWESMSSDVMFEPDLQRCICVDIRYVLWLVEKYGHAQNIINELTFVK